MKRAIDILQKQLVTSEEILALLRAQQGYLIEVKGREIKALNSQLEAKLAILNAIEGEQAEFLASQGQANMLYFFSVQPDGQEKDVLKKLLLQLRDVQLALREIKAENHLYLDRNIKYIDFSINVMTGASAGTTYGSENGSSQGSRMFEAGI